MRKFEKNAKAIFEFLEDDNRGLPEDISILFYAQNYPICFKSTNKIYYVLQDRTIVKQKHLIPVKELFIGEVTKRNLKRMLSSEIDIYTFFDDCLHKYKIGKISDKIFPYDELSSISEILDKIPQKGVKFSNEQLEILREKWK